MHHHRNRLHDFVGDAVGVGSEVVGSAVGVSLGWDEGGAGGAAVAVPASEVADCSALSPAAADSEGLSFGDSEADADAEGPVDDEALGAVVPAEAPRAGAAVLPGDDAEAPPPSAEVSDRKSVV